MSAKGTRRRPAVPCPLGDNPRVTAATAPEPLDVFLAELRAAVQRGTLVRLVLSQRRAGPASLREIRLRPVDVAGERRLARVERHATRDLTAHRSLDDGIADVRACFLPDAGPARFGHGTMTLSDGSRLQLRMNRAGDRAQLLREAGAAAGTAGGGGRIVANGAGLDADADAHAESEAAAHVDRDVADATEPSADSGRRRVLPTAAHDRARVRRLSLNAPFLHRLGLVDGAGRVVPAMARKWRQVDKFLEIVDAALDDAAVAPGTRLAVADFGSGKGYLTFAVHAHLSARLGIAPTVTGHELRADLVDFCNAVARETGAEGLSFVQGDLARATPGPLDLLIARHACDTATDEALALGVRSGARILVAAPCCHRELRPKLALPEALRPLLRHGIHLGREAEMVTDALRALALERAGYDAKVFEFVSLEHTAQNKMIAAVRRSGADARPAARAEGEATRLKAFYGVEDQALERLLVSPDTARS